MVRSRPELPGKWFKYDEKTIRQRRAIAAARHPKYEERMVKFSQRTIHPERGMLIDEIPNPRLREIADFQGWRDFVRQPEPFDSELVVEFYASMVPPAFGEFSTVVIRGVTVRITIDDICRHYHVPRFVDLDATFGIPPIPDVSQEEQHSTIISSALRRSGREIWIPKHEEILKNELRPESATWLRFVKHSLAPSTHYSDADWYVARILFCLQNDMRIDVGHIIILGITDAGAEQNKGILPFPCLITKICRDAGVPIGGLLPPMAPFDRITYSRHVSAADRFDRQQRVGQEQMGVPAHVDDVDADDVDYDPAADEGEQPIDPRIHARMNQIEQNQRLHRERMVQGFERIEWGFHYMALMYRGEQIPNDAWPFQPPGGAGSANPLPAQRGRRQQCGGRRRNRDE